MILLAQCVDSPKNLFSITLDEMAGIAKSQTCKLCFDFQKTFDSIDVFCTLSPRLYVLLGFCLLCGCLTVYSSAGHLVLGNFISKPQQQRQGVQWLCMCDL